MKVRIVIDSTADIRPELKARFSIVPLTILFGEQEYVDGVDIDHHQFYEMLVESDVMPTTSQATPAAFGKVFAEAVANGGMEHLCPFFQLSDQSIPLPFLHRDQNFCDSHMIFLGKGLYKSLCLGRLLSV